MSDEKPMPCAGTPDDPYLGSKIGCDCGAIGSDEHWSSCALMQRTSEATPSPAVLTFDGPSYRRGWADGASAMEDEAKRRSARQRSAEAQLGCTAGDGCAIPCRHCGAPMGVTCADYAQRRERTRKGAEDGVSVAGMARGREAEERVLRERDPGSSQGPGGGAVRDARAGAGDGGSDARGVAPGGERARERSGMGDLPGGPTLVGAEVATASPAPFEVMPNASEAATPTEYERSVARTHRVGQAVDTVTLAINDGLYRDEPHEPPVLHVVTRAKCECSFSPVSGTPHEPWCPVMQAAPTPSDADQEKRGT